MGIRIYKACTPSTRAKVVSDFVELSSHNPERTLLSKIHNCAKGRNNRGCITTRHRLRGTKKRYRVVDFSRKSSHSLVGTVKAISYDPNRNAFLALLFYENGKKSYIISPRGLRVGSKLFAGADVPVSKGNSLPLHQIPLGTFVHNIEINPGCGGQLVRAAGTYAQVISSSSSFVTLKLPSSEVRAFRKDCFATVGQVSNIDSNRITKGKAGKSRWLGRRPTVRGVVMNPVDHPHGGGEGRSPIGHTRPMTPWGKPALGYKTRKRNKYSDIYILRRRK